MSKTENEELAHKAWRGVAEGDAQALLDTWDSKIVWHAAGSHPWAGRFEGIKVVLNHIAEIGETCDQFDAQLDELLTSDRRIIYFFRAHVRIGTRSADVDYVMSAQHENGLMTYIWLAPMDPDALTALWE
jgi:ketosteroid isomerase-like protein